MRLCQYNGPIVPFSYLNSQEIANFPLVVEGELLSAVAQVSNDLINGFIIGTEDDAIINVDQEDDGLAVIQARVELARGKTNRLHPLVHVLVPHSSCLLLPIHIAFELEYMGFSGHALSFVSLWQAQVEGHLRRRLRVRHDKIQLPAAPSEQDG